MAEELGVDIQLKYGLDIRYRTSFDNKLIENEYVYVFFGRVNSPLKPDPNEVSDTSFMQLADLQFAINNGTIPTSYWLQYYLRFYSAEIASFIENL